MPIVEVQRRRATTAAAVLLSMVVGTVITSAAASPAVPASAVVAQPARDDRDLYLQLLETADDLSDAVELLFWALDAMSALRAREVPPEAPRGLPGSEFEGMLRDNLARVKQFPVPSYQAPLPAGGSLPTTSHEARIHLRAEMELLLGASDEISDSLQHTPMLLQLREQCDTARRVLAEVTKILQKLIAAGIDITQQLSYQWLTHELTYQPLLAQIRDAAIDKAAAIKAGVAARGGAIRAAGSTLQAALAVEAAALAGEAARIDAVAAELRQRLAALEAEEARLRTLELEARGLEAERDDLRADAEMLAALRSTSQQRISTIQDRIRDLDALIRAGYTSCPQGASYANCTHDNLKRAYDNARAQNQQRRNQEAANLQNEQRTLSNLNTRIAENNTRRQQVSATLADLTFRIQSGRQTLTAARDVYARDFAAAAWDMWRSRANVYAHENRRDSAAVTAALKGLPAK